MNFINIGFYYLALKSAGIYSSIVLKAPSKIMIKKNISGSLKSLINVSSYPPLTRHRTPLFNPQFPVSSVLVVHYTMKLPIS